MYGKVSLQQQAVATFSILHHRINHHHNHQDNHHHNHHHNHLDNHHHNHHHNHHRDQQVKYHSIIYNNINSYTTTSTKVAQQILLSRRLDVNHVEDYTTIHLTMGKMSIVKCVLQVNYHTMHIQLLYYINNNIYFYLCY